MKFNTASDTFEEIISVDKRYIVPKFQRDYSWTETEWEELLVDIDNLQDNESHYMGYLVFQSSLPSEYLVIDGQQRLTTLSLLVLAIMYNLKEMSNDDGAEDNQSRIEVLRRKFIGAQNIISLAIESKLILNRNNNDHYKRLCSLEQPPKRKIKLSEKRMTECLEYFKHKLAKKFSSGVELSHYAQEVSRRLFFTTIIVDDESNAYKVFETLNARGVKLSVPDLLKNYLFSLIDADSETTKHVLKELDDTWAYIASQLGKNDFDKFLRTDWNSRNALVTKNNLFKKIKTKITNSKEAFEYIRQLSKSSPIYAALQDSDDELWKDACFQNKKRELQALFTLNMFNITQPQTVLLAAYQHFDTDGFLKIAKSLETLSIRYNVICQKSPPEQETFYNRLARRISSKEIASISEVKQDLAKICPSDDEFRDAFCKKKFKTRQTDKKVRHLLTLLERYVSPDNELQNAALTLEHILPRNVEQDWNEFDDEQLDDYPDYLGNMTLLNSRSNEKLGNKNFDDKKKVYAKSTLEITKMICNVKDWTPEAVEKRQSWLAEKAINLWKLN